MAREKFERNKPHVNIAPLTLSTRPLTVTMLTLTAPATPTTLRT